jgi:hypothetical protein
MRLRRAPELAQLPAVDGVLHEHRLGDLELELPPRDAAVVEGRPDAGRERGLRELPRREVHAHREEGVAGRQRGLHLQELATGGAEDPVADRDDEPRVLGHRDELVGRDDAPHRVLPSHEGFDSDDAARGERHDRLVVKAQLLALEGAAQVGLEVEAVHRTDAHRLVEDLVPRASPGLRPVHGGIRVAQDVFGAFVRLASHRDPDARREENLLPIDRERLGELLLDALGDLERVRVSGDVVEEHRELVTSGPRERVARPHTALEPPRDGGEGDPTRRRQAATTLRKRSRSRSSTPNW